MNETIAVCLRHRNIYIDFSSSINKPMGEEYVRAARDCRAERFVFSSANPFVDVAEALEQTGHLGLSQKNLENMFAKNALRLLGIALETV